jgi:hypothetical protein
VVKGRHKIGGDLSRFFFRLCVGRILFTTLKDVFQRSRRPVARLGIGTARPTWLKPAAKASSEL